MDDDTLGAIGSPLVCIGSPEGSTVAAKMKSKNPNGSAEDRPALAMIEAAEEAGGISSGGRLVEPTSGDTDIGPAIVAAAKGYDLTIVMPDSMSPERREIMRAYGATTELIDGDISAAKDRTDDLEAEGMYQLRQFENPASPEAYYRTTVEEVLEQVGDRRIDALAADIGTGGTISGTGGHLVEEFPSMRVVGVKPTESAILSGHEVGNNDFQGMGPGFVSSSLDTDLLDDVEIVELTDAEAECRRLAREEGILIGQSSGTSLLAAKRVAERFVAPDANEKDQPLVVTTFWDPDERYMLTGMFGIEE